MELNFHLKQLSFKYFLIASNKKSPIEKKWNSLNCFPHYHSNVFLHLERGGNLGILGGFGGLIIIDFDDKKFQESLTMPSTFTVQTAVKKLKHYYYLLDGEMFRKFSIRDSDDKTLCDVIADGGGCVCPPSKINGNEYKIINDVPISMITIDELKKLFSFEPKKRVSFHRRDNEIDNGALQKTISILVGLGIKRMSAFKFNCPFHKSISESSLNVYSDGKLKCFHCDRYYSKVSYFIQDLELHRKKLVLL
jgi:hypothetical protein